MTRRHEDTIRSRLPRGAPPRALPLAMLLPLALAATLGHARHAPDGAGPAAAPAAADTVAPAVIALGDAIFHGRKAGGLCATCHGADARGMPGLGPDLTDAVWLHGDGGRDFLETIIRTGVMAPKQSGAMMPPFGGAKLSAAQVQAVAAYVFALSHR